MAVGSGLAAQLGAKKEATYGTYIVPTNFYEFRTENFVLDKDYLQSNQLKAGRAYPSASRRAATTRRSTGSFTLEVPTKGFGPLLDLMHDNSVTPVQNAATTAYTQTHNVSIGSSTKSATVQIGKPDASGTVQPFSALGAVLTTWQFDCDLNEFLTSVLTFDAQDLVTSEALATAAYPSGLKGFNFSQGDVKIAGSTVAAVRGFTINGGQGYKVDRFGFDATGLKKRPIPNAYATGEGTFRMEFDSLTHLNRFRNNTIAEVILTFTGDVIEGAYSDKLVITLGAVGWEGNDPVVDGPDVLDHELAIRILDNGTVPPVKIEYTSTDVTI